MAVTIDGTTGITDADGGEVLSDADYATIATALRPSIANIAATDKDNRIINGDFGIWQRGTSTSAVAFAADRWLNNGLGGGTVQSRQAFTVGETLGVNSPTYFLRQTVSGQTNPTTNFSVTLQKIEGVRSYAGQTITILGWARRSSGAGNMCLEGIQSFGTTLGSATGISPGIFGISPTTVILTDSWAPFAIVVTFPSITGKTLGTDGNDWSGFQFFTSAGADYNSRSNSLGIQNIAVDFWGIHIRVGTWTAAATADYRQRDPATELALCERYCQIVTVSAQSASIGSMSVPWNNKCTMRGTPGLTVTRTSIATINASVNGDTIVDADGGYFGIQATAAGGYVVGRQYLLSAEL